MRFLLPAILIAALSAAPSAAADRRYSVTDFERVVVEGPYVVRLVVGPSSSAVASGGQAALDRALVDVSGRTLRIRRNPHHWGGQAEAQEGPLEIELATRSLRSARIVGPGRLTIDGAEGLRVDFAVEGSGELRATGVDVDNLALGLAGAGRLEVEGVAETLTVNAQGSGDIAAAGLSAETATVTSTTTGTIRLSADRAASVTALGIGSIDVAGRPACTLRGPNAGLVRCGSDQR